MMQELRRHAGDGEATQPQEAALAPVGLEMMGADGASGSQMPQMSGRKLELW